MRTQVSVRPDVTLEDHCDLWDVARGVRVSTAPKSWVPRGFGITVETTGLHRRTR